MNKIITGFILTAFAALNVAGEIVVSDVVATPKYPWSDQVDIGYTVSGSDEAVQKLSVYAEVEGARYYGGEYEGSCLAEGRHVVVWRRPENLGTGISKDVVFGVELKGDSLGVESLYWAIDLQTGEQTFFDAVPAGGWSDAYKTTKLLLRKIEPGNVTVGRTKPVTLTKPFFIGVFEVTQSQYELIEGSNPSSNRGAKRPVECVSYAGIRGIQKGAAWPAGNETDDDSWLGKLKERTGVGLDLPTESQWEYACRAGTSSAYNNGGSTVDDLRMLGRYYYNGFDGHGEYATESTTVGSYLPNAWGLYDMHGNVDEWCLDWYAELNDQEAVDYKGADSGSYRVSRGGHWWGDYGGCYSFARGDYRAPDKAYAYLGFRLAMQPTSLSALTAASQPIDVDFGAAVANITKPSEVVTSMPFDKSWFGVAAAKIVAYDNGVPFGESTEPSGTFIWTPTFGSHRLILEAFDADGQTLGRLTRVLSLTSSAKVLSAKMRSDNPSVMDITYRVDSPFETANVRVLAFENGIRSFANVWRPRTFVEGTESNIGSAVPANRELHLAWKAVDDLGVASQNVMIEILVEEAQRPLPLSFVRIPAQGSVPALTFSPTVPTDAQLFDALLWLYADQDPDLTLKDGVLSISGRDKQLQHVYEKMGLSVLNGDLLNSVNALMHQDFKPEVHAYRLEGRD